MTWLREGWVALALVRLGGVSCCGRLGFGRVAGALTEGRPGRMTAGKRGRLGVTDTIERTGAHELLPNLRG